MSDITKSLKEIFEERISSPFYGSLIISWLLWNWEIPYVTFIIDQDKLGTVEKIVNGTLTNIPIPNKIEYILIKCSNFHSLVTLPLLSTAIILLLMPFLTNGAYWITLKFDKWRVDKKNDVEKTKLLSEVDSLRLRNEMFSQEERFVKIIKSKDEEIESLNGQLKLALEEKQQESNSSIDLNNSDKPPTDFGSDRSRFLNKPIVRDSYQKLYDSIKNFGTIRGDIPEDVVKFCIAYQLITKIGPAYKITAKGEYMYLELMKFEVNKQL